MSALDSMIKWRKTHAVRESFNVSIDERKGLVVERRDKKKRKVTDGRDTWFYVGFVGEIGFTIALPIAGGACLGLFLDRTWSSYPKATIALLFFGIVISCIAFVATIREVIGRKNS